MTTRHGNKENMPPLNENRLAATRAESSQLSTEVGACLPVMSVVSKQLTDVSQIVESGVVSACSRFAPMTRQIHELNLPAVRHKIGSLTQLMQEQSQLNAQLLSMLGCHIERRACGMEASIESAAGQSLQQLVDMHESLLEAGRVALEMQRITCAVDEHLHSAMRLTESLHVEIMGCVSDMQFQDAISQRLEHLVQVLRGMSQAICERLSMSETQLGDDPNPWLEMLSGSYTMESERQMHAASRVVHPSQPADSDIELF